MIFPLFFSLRLKAQLVGCTDPMANNYNAAATVNNGSCTYNGTSYTPPVKVDPINDTLNESSGLQMADGNLWTFNDRGGEAAIYKIDTLSNKILQRVYLGGATNTDWEDIAFDGTFLYIGDFGNNLDGARTDLKIYKFPVASIPPQAGNPVVTIPFSMIQTINFSYADQLQPPAPVALNTAQYDCEAMIVDSGQIHLFSKNWVNQTCTHYIIPSTAAGTYSLSPKETLATGFLVTAADKPTGQDIIALYGYQKTGAGNHFIELLSAYSNGAFFNGNKRQLTLPNAAVMGQGEGITFKDDSTGYISNEKFSYSFAGFTLTVYQKLRTFNIGPYVSNFVKQYIFTGNGNWSDNSNWKNSDPPPALLPMNSSIYIDPVASGACVLDIPYTVLTGKKITVAPGKNLVIKGTLQINQ